MIYTITFNPAIDYTVTLPEYRAGAVNRAVSEKLLAGGKGINVSIVLASLGVESTALGFAAGFTGRQLIKMLDGIGCKTDLIELESGYTRINVKIKAETETEINAPGPDIGAEDMEKLFKKLGALKAGDTLVLAGSIPPSLPDTVYCDIMERLADKRVDIIVDAEGDLLANALKYRPFLVKPNNHELGGIFGVELKTREDVLPYARKLRDMGARNVLVSMAGDGAVFAAGDGREYMSAAPNGRVVNSTGAGDSMVAGFIAGFKESGDYMHAFKTGLAAGSASAFSEDLATKDEVLKIYNALK